MTDERFDPIADGELLSAYLAGDLDAATAAEVERRLADEPQLASQLDALADALVALGGFDDIETPAGYEDRLSRRLAAPPAAPADLAAHRERRAGRTSWARIGTVAAILLAGTVMAGTALRSVGGGGADVVMESADDSAGATSESSSSALDSGSSTRPSAPVILDDNIKIASEEALRRRYEALPEVQALLGVPLDEATQLAMVFEDAVASRDTVVALNKDAAATAGTESFSAEGSTGAGSTAPEEGSADEAGDAERTEASGGPESSASQAEPVPPEPAQLDADSARGTDRRANRKAADPCLDAITKDAAAPLVPVRVETLRYAGERAISYVLVTSTPGSDELDRTEVWVVRPSDCVTIVFQQY